MSPDPEKIARLVRLVVAKTLGDVGQGVNIQKFDDTNRRRIVGEEAVRQMPTNTNQAIHPGSIVTPLAQQIAQERRIQFIFAAAEDIEREPSQGQFMAVRSSSGFQHLDGAGRAVALGADHGGFELKELIKGWLNDSGYLIIDCGAHNKESVDYPDYAFTVAQHIAGGRAFRGVIVDGAGIGSCIAANKVPGIRAAMCYDQATAMNSREHNNANVLTLGAGLIGPTLAKQIVLTWITASFGGGRHARRVDKIEAIERRFSK